MSIYRNVKYNTSTFERKIKSVIYICTFILQIVYGSLLLSNVNNSGWIHGSCYHKNSKGLRVLPRPFP